MFHFTPTMYFGTDDLTERPPGACQLDKGAAPPYNPLLLACSQHFWPFGPTIPKPLSHVDLKQCTEMMEIWVLEWELKMGRSPVTGDSWATRHNLLTGVHLATGHT